MALIVCERVNPQPQTDTPLPPHVERCVDCSAWVFEPINVSYADGCLCSYCDRNGRPQRPGSSSLTEAT